MADLRHPHEYINWVMGLTDFTPVAETAKAVCAIRGQDPHAQVLCIGSYIPRWRATVLESVLMAAIAREEPAERLDKGI
jgi:hypothetical protein